VKRLYGAGRMADRVLEIYTDVVAGRPAARQQAAL
jgi:hypothetical protein